MCLSVSACEFVLGNSQISMISETFVETTFCVEDTTKCEYDRPIFASFGPYHRALPHFVDLYLPHPSICCKLRR